MGLNINKIIEESVKDVLGESKDLVKVAVKRAADAGEGGGSLLRKILVGTGVGAPIVGAAGLGMHAIQQNAKDRAAEEAKRAAEEAKKAAENKSYLKVLKKYAQEHPGRVGAIAGAALAAGLGAAALRKKLAKNKTK